MQRLDFLAPAIDTARLRLRHVRMEDAEPLFALFEHWNVVQWLGLPSWPGSLEGTRTHIGRCMREGAAYEEYRVIELADGTLIGGIGWRRRPASEEQRAAGPNIGYWLGEPYWGSGYMSEAVEALCGAIFAGTEAPVIYSGLFEGNDASLRIQRKLGFTIAGRILKFSGVQRKELPHLNTELTRAAFDLRPRMALVAG